MAKAAKYDWVAKLAEEYYQTKVTSAPKLLNERDGQQVFRLKFSDGVYYTLRLCPEGRDRDRVLADVGVLSFLKAAKFPAPYPIALPDGTPIFEWRADCWAYLTNYLEGVNPESFSLQMIGELGKLLATLHKLADTPKEFPFQVNWLGELPTAIKRAEAASKHETWGKLAREVAQNLKSLPDLKGLPQGLIHTDVHEGNILVSPDHKLYLLDWEDAGLDAAIFDVALVLGWSCVWQHDEANFNFDGQPDLYNFDEEYSRHFLASYQKVRNLSQKEAANLGNAVRFLNGWFAARDIEREVEEPGVSDGLAFTTWAIMRSVTPEWSATLAQWATEER
jgi:Ser/Thr protein kinase RdoA (MazF antagonist)